MDLDLHTDAETTGEFRTPRAVESRLAPSGTLSRMIVASAVIALIVTGMLVMYFVSRPMFREEPVAAMPATSTPVTAPVRTPVLAVPSVPTTVSTTDSETLKKLEAVEHQIGAIEEALEAMHAEMRETRPPLEADRTFHLRIAEATRNGALVAVVKMLWDERTGPLYQQLEHHYESPALWTAAMAEHRAVVKAIAGHDAAAARRAMQRHLNGAYKRFSKGWNTQQ